ncbi:MAG: hypothetical protein ACPG31_05675 [Planctomycetota bacterium]
MSKAIIWAFLSVTLLTIAVGIGFLVGEFGWAAGFLLDRLALVLAIAGVTWALRKSSWAGTLLTVALLSGIICAEIFRSTRMDEAKRKGDGIALQVHFFLTQNGRVPEDLDELSEAFPTGLPSPGVGFFFNDSYYYESNMEGTGFSLGFSARHGLTWWRNEAGGWKLED